MQSGPFVLCILCSGLWLSSSGSILGQGVASPRGWKALGAAQKAYNVLKESKAIASLPSHISKAKATLQVLEQTGQLDRKYKEDTEESLPRDSDLEDVLTRNWHSEAKTRNKDKSNFAEHSCPSDSKNKPAKSGYTIDQLSLPVLALCLLSGMGGWFLRDRLPPNEKKLKDLSVEEIVEELSRSASSPEEKNNLQEGEIEVNSNLASPESKFKQGLSSKSHETKVHIQTFENAPGATGSSQNNNEEVDADKSTHTQNFDRGFKGNTQVLPEIYPTQVEVPEQESMDILASNRQSSSLEETSHEDISRIQEGKPSESNEQEPSGLRDHISDNHEENSALDERRMSGGEASTRNKSGVVKKNVESSLGWLDKAELESQLPPTVGLGGVMDLVTVMKYLAAQSGQNTEKMTAEQRMQLQQMSIQYCQQQQNNWLHAQANILRGDTLDHKRMQSKRKEARLQQERLRLALQDGLTSGLWLTLSMSLFCGIKCGYLGHQLGRCPSVQSLPAFGFWRPWAILEAGKLALCYIDYTREALLGCGIMLVTAYGAVKAGAFSSSPHDSPLLKLLIALGVICGFAGYQAVGRLGGDSSRWLFCWETWVLMHCLASWQMPKVQASLGEGRLGSLKAGLYQTCLSIAFPVLMAIVPFPGCVSYVKGLMLNLVIS